MKPPRSTDHALAVRPEYVRDVGAADHGVVQKPLGLWEKLYANGALRKLLLLALMAAVWEVYATVLKNPLLFPTFSDTLGAFYAGISNGVLLTRAAFSIKVLLQ